MMAESPRATSTAYDRRRDNHRHHRETFHRHRETFHRRHDHHRRRGHHLHRVRRAPEHRRISKE
jgi:hypothetical protein